MLGKMSLHRSVKGIRKGKPVPIVTIDGCKVRVKKDATVLDAAKKAGPLLSSCCFMRCIVPALHGGA